MQDYSGLLILIAIIVFLLPTIIAFSRNHHYKWVILGVNILGFTGIAYLVAFIWSVWPKQTAFFDVLTNDPTTNSPEAGQKIYGQMGSNVGAFIDEKNKRSTVTPMSTLPISDRSDQDYEEMLRRLAKLRDDGIITEEEFSNKKKAILRI